MLSNSAVTVHHLALLYTKVYDLSTNMLSTCLLSDVSQIERLLSRFRCACHGLHVDTGQWVDTKREDRLCQVKLCHSSKDVEVSSIFCLVAQLTVIIMLDSMPVFFFCSMPFLFQTFSLTLNQMHVVVSSEGVFHVEIYCINLT